jgi:hypothetical protein
MFVFIRKIRSYSARILLVYLHPPYLKSFVSDKNELICYTSYMKGEISYEEFKRRIEPYVKG